MPHLYVIAGPHGAGKTKASRTVLPNVFRCTECFDVDDQFLFNQSLLKMTGLLIKKADFAIKTTLATQHGARMIGIARKRGYGVTLLYYWLPTPEMSKERVKMDIPERDIEQIYYKGIHNLVNYFLPLCDNWMIINSGGEAPAGIAVGKADKEKTIIQADDWQRILEQSK